LSTPKAQPRPGDPAAAQTPAESASGKAAGAKTGGLAPVPGPGTRPEKPGPGTRPEKPDPQAPGKGGVRPVAGAARLRPRHRAVALSFLVMVLLPGIVAAGYLYTRAADQYVSTTGFAVRTQEANPTTDLLGGLTSSLAGVSSSSDTDILYEFIRSQELVRRVDDRLDLRALYSGPRDSDPVFTLDPEGSIEDLVDYWQRMVRVFYDGGTGLIELRVRAFAPDDAHAIAETVFEESTEMINELSAIARDDATRYAREELDAAVERLKTAREALTRFRSETRIVDPTADIQGQMGVLSTLQQQLAAALIELDLLRDNAGGTDPRVTQAERRIEVIRARIDDEREKFGFGGGTMAAGEDYATILAEFERLTVDREFAERAYTGALAAYDAAQAEARRKSRYLAAYVRPTMPEDATRPRRAMLVGLVVLFAAMAWAISVVVWSAIKDRR